MNVYRIGHTDTTPAEPVPGFYYTTTDGDGAESEPVGPFATADAAIDDMSGGELTAYRNASEEERRAVLDAWRR